MSVIIRLQNLPWSANALDIRNFFRGLSIPEGGVHIVGGELGDAFIAFSTDEDARQAMMLDCGKLKEIQVKLLLSSRSEMHKVIETARQSVPILQLTAPAPAPAPAAPPPAPLLTPFAAALAGHAALGIPGIGNPLEVPQPAVIEPPAPLAPSPPTIITPADPAPEVHDIDTRDTKENRKRNKDKRRTRSKSRSRSSSRSRSRDKKDRRRDRRDRSRSRDRRRRNRSRSRDRKDRRRDRKEKSRSRERVSPWSSRGGGLRKHISPPKDVQENNPENQGFASFGPGPMLMGNGNGNALGLLQPPVGSPGVESFDVALSRLQELGKKRNPEAFQGSNDMMNGGPRGFNGGPAGGNQRAETARRSRFEASDENGCCVAIRGVPTHTSYGDLRRFFPFMIDKHGIKMINDQLGRRTGTVFVRFVEPRSKALALHRRNNDLKGAEVRVEHLPDEEFDAAVDSFLPVRHDPPPVAPAPPPLAEPEPPQAPFTVLRLGDLPLFVKEHDIIKAFSEFSLLSIIMSENRASRTRSACVQFVKAEDARAALACRNRLVFARRVASVSPVSDDEYDKEKLAQLEREAPAPAPAPERLPPPQFQREVSPEGPPAPLPPQLQLQPEVPRDPRQRRPPLDGPLLQPGAPFFQPDFAQQQMLPMGFQAPLFGGFPGAGGLAGDPRDPRRRNAMPPAAAPHTEDDDTLDCVLMKGLPRDASDRDIVEFLQETGAVPARIHLMLDVGGAPSGDCFCEFRSEDEARLAARRHGAKLQGCRVSVDPVPRAVVQDALAPEPITPVPQGFPLRDPSLLGDGPAFFEPHQRGGFGPSGPGGLGGPGGPRPYRGRGGSIFERGGFGRGANRGRGSYERGGANFGAPSFGRGNDNFERNGGGFNREDEDFDRGNNFDRGNGGFDRGGRGGFDRGGRGGFGSRGFEPRGRGRGFGRGRGGGGGGGVGGGGGFDGERPQNSPGDEQDPPEDFGAPGCVVSMENVPFRASVEDILIFFGDFNLSTDDVIRRFNDRGQPTGDARVAFRSPFDAQRAVAARHMQQIQDRRVSLTLL